MNEQRNNDDPRDAHLLAALRHAPDRDALPPREVSARILAAARAAASQPSRAAPWWQRVGAWLVQPQVAASFGTLAVASIVGLMWSTREPPWVEPAPRQSVAEQGAAEQAAATSAVASTAAPAAAPSELRRDERDLLAQTTPATPAPKQEAAPRRAKEARTVDKAGARPAPAASPETVADSVAAAPAPPAERLEEARGADAAVSADTAKASRPRVAAASMPALESSSRQALAIGNTAAADPLARIDALLAGGDGSWSSADRALPHGPAQAAWWAQLRRATAGAWQPALPTRADAAAASPSLRLRVAGQGIASFDFAADSVQWCAADRNACWRAPLTAAQREAWIAEVARW